MVTGQAIYSLHIGDGLKEIFDGDTAIKEMVAADKIEIIFDEKWHVGVNASDMFYFASADHVEIESRKALEALYRSCVADPKRGHVAWASELLSNLVEIPFQANCRSVRRSRHPVDLAML